MKIRNVLDKKEKTKTVKIALIVALSILVVSIFASFLTTKLSFSYTFLAFSPNGDELNAIIDVNNCTRPLTFNSTTYDVPSEYQDAGQTFIQTINDTHASVCWYDLILIEDITIDYLTSYCRPKADLCEASSSCDDSEGIYYVCDEGFEVEVLN